MRSKARNPNKAEKTSTYAFFDTTQILRGYKLIDSIEPLTVEIRMISKKASVKERLWKHNQGELLAVGVINQQVYLTKY